jgi:hypothetical protein
MKKFFAILFVSVAVIILSCGSADTADVGVRITKQVPAHGHNNALDGGVLRVSNTILSMGATTLPLAPGGTSFSCNSTQFTGTIIDRLSLYTAPATSIRVPVGYSYAKAIGNIVVSMPTYTHAIAAGVRITKNGGVTAPDCLVTKFAEAPATSTADNDITYTISVSCPYITVTINDTLGATLCNGSRTGSMYLDTSRSWVSYELYR